MPRAGGGANATQVAAPRDDHARAKRAWSHRSMRKGSCHAPEKKDLEAAAELERARTSPRAASIGPTTAAQHSAFSPNPSLTRCGW